MVVGGVAAGRQAWWRSSSQELTSDPQALREAERELTRMGCLKATPSETPPPTRSHFLILPK